MDQNQTFMKSYDNILSKLILFEKRVALLAFIAMTLLNIFQIFIRYIFNYQFMWIQDFTILLSGWMIFLGFAVVTYNKGDLVVSLIIRHLPDQVKIIMRIIGNILVLIFLLYFSFHAYELFVVQLGDMSAVARIPLSLYTCPLIIAGVSMFLVYLKDLIIDVMHLLSKKNDWYERTEDL